jgi:hypothetical protein
VNRGGRVSSTGDIELFIVSHLVLEPVGRAAIASGRRSSGFCALAPLYGVPPAVIVSVSDAGEGATILPAEGRTRRRDQKSRLIEKLFSALAGSRGCRSGCGLGKL